MTAIAPAPRRTAALVLLAAGVVGASWLVPGPQWMSGIEGHAGPAAIAGRPETVVKPLSCEALSDLPGKSVTTATVTFPPAGYTPAHRHPGAVTAYVLKGAVRSQLAGGPAIVYRKGDTWFEPPGALHLFAENASETRPAEILAFFVTDTDCGSLVIPEK